MIIAALNITFGVAVAAAQAAKRVIRHKMMNEINRERTGYKIELMLRPLWTPSEVNRLYRKACPGGKLSEAHTYLTLSQIATFAFVGIEFLVMDHIAV